MKSSERFQAAIALLAGAFNREMGHAAIEAYWIALQCLTELELSAATTRALSECRFMPSASELLAFAGRGSSLEAETVEAWEAVRRAIDRHDYTDSVDFGPRVNAVVRNLGGWLRLCALPLEELNVWARKEFERIYGAFAGKDSAALNGDPHMGAFGGAPIPIAIGGRLPVRQLGKGKVGTEAIALVHRLAEAKS